MNDKRMQLGWPFLLVWVLATAVGYFLGWMAGFFLGHFLLGPVMLGIAIGTCVGFMQRLVLLEYGLRFDESALAKGWALGDRWVLAGIAGLAVCLGLHGVVAAVWGYHVDLAWPGILGWAAAFTVGGTLIGVLQQRMLRRRVDRSIWWIPVSAAGWGSSIFGLGTPSKSIFVIMLLGPAIGGVCLGTVTGGALIRLLGHPRPG